MPLFSDKPNNYKGVTLSWERNAFIEANNINLSNFVSAAIDKARCKHYIEVRPDQEKWLDNQHINLNLVIQAAIDQEIKNHG